MCGRYTLQNVDDISERFQAKQLRFELASVYNVAPSQELPVVVADEDGERSIKLMQWGLIPRWQTLGHGGVAPINARAETVAEKPMFRDLIRRRRCLVPVSGFYEWQARVHRKQPYFIGVKDQPLFAFAGLYDEFAPADDAPVASYAILTTRANALLAPIHDRMPVILRPEDEGFWLDPKLDDVRALEPLFDPRPSEDLVAYPIATTVNDARNDGPELIKPRQLPLARAS
ncbi:MAG TPA: SOS response-associated peptidase [Thermomicrobiales bacterium]|jgi:putative SOS response-associated peptidase YedK